MRCGSNLWRRLAIVALAGTLVVPVSAAFAQRGRGVRHGGSAWHWSGGGWHGGGWHRGGWGWGFGLGVVVPPLYAWPSPYYYAAPPYYPPPVYYPPPTYYPPQPAYPYPYGYQYENAPGYYTSGVPAQSYSSQPYPQPGYRYPPAPDPTNCGTPYEPKPCKR